MNYSSPIVPLVANAINLDALIKAAQLSLSVQCPWLDYVFGRAITGQQLDESTKRAQTFPMVHGPDNEYMNLGPNSHYGSHAFFQVTGAETPVDYSAFMPNTYRVELALVCLYNVDLVAERWGRPADEVNGETLKQALREALAQIGIDTVLRIDESPTEVFRGYSYNHLQHQTFMHPEGGIKIAFVAHYLETKLACAVGTDEPPETLNINGRMYQLV